MSLGLTTSPSTLGVGAAPEPIRMRTLIGLRWVALAGQCAAVAGALMLGVHFPLAPVLAVIGLSVGLNLWLASRRPGRLSAEQTLAQLCFDEIQVGVLLTLVGGISNPFALFILPPLTIAAAALPLRHVAVIGAVTAGVIGLMSLTHGPLTFAPDAPLGPRATLQLGHVLALAIGGAFFAIYAHRVSSELAAAADALGATQMALAREQRLQHLGGVVAAAAHEMGTPLATIKLIASELRAELEPSLSDRPELVDDLRQLCASADRCRDILRGMGQAGKDDLHLRHAPLTEILNEAAAPHRERGIAIDIRPSPAGALSMTRDAGLIHGLRNLIQNAVDFAAARVVIEASLSAGVLRVAIRDDGPGYPPHLLARLGEPFLTTRRAGATAGTYEGMGLGLFIARTLLERSGGTVAFGNDRGAVVTVTWPASAVLTDGRAALGRNPAIES